MRAKVYDVSEAVIAKARRSGVYGDTVARLYRMARRSALSKSRFGNRRFHAYVLQIDGTVIKDVTRVGINEGK